MSDAFVDEDREGLKKSAEQDLKLLIALKPKPIITKDNPRGLSARRVGPGGDEYREALDSVLTKYNGRAGFEQALEGIENPKQIKEVLAEEPEQIEEDLEEPLPSAEPNILTETTAKPLPSAEPDILTESTDKNKFNVRDGKGKIIASFSLEGSTPSETEMQQMLSFLETMEIPEDESEPTPTGHGPLRLVSPKFRRAVGDDIALAPGLTQLLTQIAPSAAGAFAGAKLGLAATAAIPIPGARVAGVVGGGIAGAFGGELAGQELGITPNSKANLALAAAGPLAGTIGGGILKLFRLGTGKIITKGLPGAKLATARNFMGRAVEKTESMGATILNGTKGVTTRPARELYEAAFKAGVRIKPALLRNTRTEIDRIIKQLSPSAPLDGVQGAINALENVKEVLLNNPKGVLLEDLILARSHLGASFSQLQNNPSLKQIFSTKVFGVLSDDLNKIALSPFKKGSQTRLAQEGIKRAKLQFSVQTLERKVAQFTRQNVKGVPDGVAIDFNKMSNWIVNITNPKHAKFDKNFTEALKEHLPAMKKTIAELADITVTGSPGGPGSLVVRGQFAKLGRIAGGAALGFLGTGGNVIGAGVGAVLAAQTPEMVVGMLTSPVGARFLLSAAKLGKGEISHRAWMVGTTLVFRAMGEKREQPSSPGGPKSSSVGPVTIDTPTTLKNKETDESKRARKRLPEVK